MEDTTSTTGDYTSVFYREFWSFSAFTDERNSIKVKSLEFFDFINFILKYIKFYPGEIKSFEN